MLAAGLAIATPAETAAAKPGFVVAERALRLTLKPAATNGYAVRIETEGHRRVTLTASKGGATAVYRTTGRVDRRGIEAEFGRLGRISVRFEGRRRPFPGLLPPALEARLPDLDLSLDCHGRKPVREVGGFRGTIRFEGENGFTRVDARRAGGEVRRYYTRVCERYPGSAGRPARKGPGLFEGLRVSLLYATDRSPRRIVGLESLGLEFGPIVEILGPLYVVTTKVVERREAMLIVRTASELGDEETVTVSPPRRSPVTAKFALAGPFNGTARYRKERGSPAIWSGSLTSRPPGAGLVPLTGPGFSAVLCRLSFADVLSNRCLRRADAPLPGPFEVAPPIATRLRALLRAPR